MIQPTHILTKLGILSSFSVARRLSEKDIQKYFIKYAKKGKSTEEIHKMFIQKIENDILSAMENGTVPGILNRNGLNITSMSDKVPIINKLIIFIAHKIMGMNYDKLTMCYIINTLVNLLNLTDEDFEAFHKKHNEDDDDDDDDDDESSETIN